MASKFPWRSVLASCLCGAALWPAMGLTAKDDVAIPLFAPDVATAWQVNHPDGDDYIPPAERVNDFETPGVMRLASKMV